jgi:hypothetical protein
MRAWICRAAVLLALLAPTWSAPAQAQEDVEAKLMAMEEALWEAWKTGDWEVFRSHMTEGAVNNGAGGATAGRDAMIEGMAGASCDVQSYELSDMQVHQIARGTAILTYRAEQAATCEGEALPSPVWASAVYVNDGGEWKNAFYQETPARK